MLKRLIGRTAQRLGYQIARLPPREPPRDVPAPPPFAPVWPLPRAAGGPDDSALRRAFAGHPHWHFAYEFEGGLAFRTAHNRPGLNTDDRARPLQRFRHFMPYLVEAAGGTLAGKRVLDMACNSGFWSIQCALLGAEVVGFDARAELIAQADLLKRVTGAAGADFHVLDFREASPETLGTFDIVLNLGLLYHLPDPQSALARTMALSRRHILLDTATDPSDEPLMSLKWEEPIDIRMAAQAGVVALPSASGVELMLRHVGASRWLKVPVRSGDIPDEYRTRRRASWLIEI